MRNTEDVDTFSKWLTTIQTSVKPSLKVNGASYPHAVIAIDFGTPIEPVRLSSEQSTELASRMKELTTHITGRRNVRVNHDNNNGVYWASV